MKKLLVSLVILAAIAGCKRESHSEELIITMSTSIAGSRTTITGDVVAFANNDKIGLFETLHNGADAKEWTYTLSNTSWTSATDMYWKDKTSNHSFYAFYPYAASSDYTSIAMPALKSQAGDIASLSTCDFLYAEPVVNKTFTTAGVTAGKVNLNFKHASALIVLNVKSTAVVADATFTEFTLTKEDIATGKTINLSNSTATIGTPAENVISVSPSPAKTLTTTATPYYVVVNDKTATGIVFGIDFSKDSVNYAATGTLEVPDSKTEFSASTKYTYNITVDQNVVSVGDVVIEPWTPVVGGDVEAN